MCHGLVAAEMKLELSAADFVDNHIKLTQMLRFLKNKTEQPENSKNDRQLDRTKHRA